MPNLQMNTFQNTYGGYISTHVNSFGFNGDLLNIPSYHLSKVLLVTEDIKCTCSYIHKVLHLAFKITFLLAPYTKRMTLFLKVNVLFKNTFHNFFKDSFVVVVSSFIAVSELRLALPHCSWPLNDYYPDFL